MAYVNDVGFLDNVIDIEMDDDDLCQLPSQNKFKYVQNTIKGVERSFTLFDTIYLTYCLENIHPKGFKEELFKNKSVAICTANLTYIDAKPDKKRYLAWGWFFTALVIIALAMTLAFAISEYNTFAFNNVLVKEVFSRFKLTHEEMQQASIGLAIFGVIALIVFLFKTRKIIIYKSYVGRVPIFELVCYPRNKKFNNYIQLLELCMHKAHNRNGVTMNYRLMGELKYLRKMYEAGIIANTDYEKARKAILSHKEYS